MYQNLRSLRNKKGIPVNVFLDRLGLKTKAAYYKKETSRVAFTVEEAKEISDIIELPIEEIFFEKKVS